MREGGDGQGPVARSRVTWRAVLTALYALAVAAGLILLALRHIDANWDLRNYHIAGPRLALSGVAWDHVIPAGIQTYFPMLFYFPTYYGLSYFGPLVWRIVLVAWQALFWPIVLGTFWMVLQRESVAAASRRPGATLVLLVVLAGVGGMSLSVLGTTFADLSLAVVIGAAIARALYVGFSPNIRRGVEIGALLGIAVGLKSTSIVTAAPFAIAFYAVSLLVSRDVRGVLRECATFVGVAFVAVLALTGYWMIEVYRVTGNPAYPYANAIFKSPLAAPANWADTRFIPSSFKGWIGRPFRLAISQSYLISEAPFRDVRYALFFYLILPMTLAAGVLRPARVSATLRAYPYTTCLTGFYLVGILMWAALFSIGRYMPMFEMLTGFLILRFLLAIDRTWSLPAVAAVGALHLATTCVPDWGSLPRTADGSTGYADAPPALGNALVFLDAQPMGYVLPYLATDARVVLRAQETEADSYYGDRVRALQARRWRNGIWYVSEAPPDREAALYLAGYGLALTDECVVLATWYRKLRACRISRPISAR